MAKTRGHTIARLWHVSGSSASRPHASGMPRVAGMPQNLGLQPLGLLCVLVACWMFAGSPCAGEGPAGKSRYRSANQAQATHTHSADADGDRDAPSPQSDRFGLRSLLGGKSGGTSSRQSELLSALPMERLTEHAKEKLAAVTEKPTLFRRLPTQAIRCDEELFLFLTRHPEAIIGIWDLMGITKVQATRTGPYRLDAVDGSGTTCQIDLLYGDPNLHVFLADGMYDGKFVQKPILGKGVFVFKSTYADAADGSTTVTGTLDCYIKFESLGADIIARSLGGLIGKSADHNFIETASFISQISQACEKNPEGMLEMVDRMPQIDAATRAEFARTIIHVSQRHLANTTPAAKLVQDRGITPTQR